MPAIILVDDDAGIRDSFSTYLTKAGFSVSVFESYAALSGSNFTEPDIFLIDQQLQGCSGVDLCRLLKSREGMYGKTPVIIFSASPRAASAARLAGASGFLEKPFKNALLIRLINELIGEK